MVPLDSASAEDLNLIDRAIDEDREGSDEDWSSILGVNLRHCIKMRRNSSSKHVDHALRLFGLPSDINSCSSLSHLKWQRTRSRSTTQIIHDGKQSSKYVSSRHIIKKENEVIQYKRRKSKSKPILSEHVRNTSENSTAITSDIDNSGVGTSELDISVSINETTASISSSNPVEGAKVTNAPSPAGGILHNGLEKCLLLHGVCVTAGDKATEDFSEIHATGEVCDRFLNTSVELCGISHSPVKKDGKCTSENKEIRSLSSTSFQDFIESESIVQVDGRIVSVRVVLDHGMGEYGFAKGISLIENGSCVVDAPCNEEIMYSASSYKPGDKAIDEEIPGVSIRTPDGVDDKKVPGHGNLSNYDQDSLAPVDDQHFTAGEHICDAKSRGLENSSVKTLEEKPSVTKSWKRNRELEQLRKGKYEVDDFIRSPCEGLRPRSNIASTSHETDANISDTEEPATAKKKSKQIISTTSTSEYLKPEKPSSKGLHRCDLEGCLLTFKSKSELILHQQNQCHIQGCRKKFTCHRYLITHQRVHADDRPLKCSWKGCNMSFKWAWARTEHLRVHTGERPYKCKAEDCGKRFRFISDFSRHRRKTGHVY